MPSDDRRKYSEKGLTKPPSTLLTSLSSSHPPPPFVSSSKSASGMPLDFLDDPIRYYNVVQGTAVTRFCTVSAVFLLLWDWATHFEDEVEYVWRRDWKMAGKPLYLLVRYVGFAFQVYDLVQMLGSWGKKFSAVYYVLLPIGTPFFLFAVDVVLAYRTMCLFRMDRKLLYVNIVFFTLCVLSTAGLCAYSFSQFGVVSTPRYLTGAWATMPSTTFLTAMPPLVFELRLFVLVLIKLVRYHRDIGPIGRKSIIKLLIQDSMSWFFFISGAILWNAITLAVAPEGYRGMALPFFRTFIVIGGCRLVIHMRRQMYQHPDQNTVATAIEFRGPVTTTSGSMDSATRAKVQVLRTAQRMGLPPVNSQMLSFWPDDVTQLGAMGGQQLELGELPTTARQQVLPPGLRGEETAREDNLDLPYSLRSSEDHKRTFQNITDEVGLVHSRTPLDFHRHLQVASSSSRG